MIISYEQEINATHQEAWDLILDFENRPKWIPFMESCYITDKKENWIGTRYQEKEVIIGIPVNINYEIIQWIENQKMVSKCLMAPFYPHVTIIVDEIPGSKKIKSKLDVEIELGPFKFMPKFLLQKQIDFLFQPLVKNFKIHLEANTSLK